MVWFVYGGLVQCGDSLFGLNLCVRVFGCELDCCLVYGCWVSVWLSCGVWFILMVWACYYVWCYLWFCCVVRCAVGLRGISFS